MAIGRCGINRRAVLAAIAGPMLGGADGVPAGYYADQKVVYQNDGRPGDLLGYFRQVLANLQNHINAVGRDHLSLRVVSFAAGVDLFMMANSDAGLGGALDRLRQQGVVFLICHNTLEAGGIDWRTLYGVHAEDVVPSGVAEIARLEGMGYVYIRP